MAVSFTIDVDGVREFDRAFNRVEDTIKDFREVWPTTESVVFEIVADQFASGGTKGASGAWEGLKESTMARKGFMGFFPLVDTGDLKASVSRKGAEYQISEMSANELTMGTTRPGAVHHQRGGNHLAKRPIYDFSEESKRKLQKEGLQRPLRAILRRSTTLVQSNAGDV